MRVIGDVAGSRQVLVNGGDVAPRNDESSSLPLLGADGTGDIADRLVVRLERPDSRLA